MEKQIVYNDGEKVQLVNGSIVLDATIYNTIHGQIVASKGHFPVLVKSVGKKCYPNFKIVRIG